MRTRYSIFLSITLVCATFVPLSAYAQSNNYQWQQQQMRQQQMMQQQQQQQRQLEMQRQQQEQARRQQEAMRQQQVRQQEAMRQQQMRQQQITRERQQQAMQQRQQMAERQRQVQQQQQRQMEQQRQRQTNQQKLHEQQVAQGQRSQLVKQQQALQQRQALQQQRQIKDRQERLYRLQQDRLRKEKADKKKRDTRDTIAMATLLSRQQVRPSPIITQSKPTTLNQSVKQFQQNRLQQQKLQRTSKQLAAHRKAVQIRAQKIRAVQKRLIAKRQVEKKRQLEQTATQKLAEANFGVCEGRGCGNNKCSFHGDTQVLTRNGYEAIKLLTVGDFVWARNEYTGDTDWKPVTAHYFNLYEETVAVTARSLPDGKAQTILSNRIHPFYVSDLGVRHKKTELADVERDTNKAGQWVQAQALQPGNLLFTDSGYPAEVISLDIKGEPLKAYNFTVDEYHTYFVKGAFSHGTSAVWVHNDCNQEGKNIKGRMLGDRGVQIASKTLWRGEGKERIDVENPNPGQRPGQIHYQDGNGNKYLYDSTTKSFLNAPNSINKLLEDSGFQRAINKGMRKYLGE